MKVILIDDSDIWDDSAGAGSGDSLVAITEFARDGGEGGKVRDGGDGSSGAGAGW